VFAAGAGLYRFEGFLGLPESSAYRAGALSGGRFFVENTGIIYRIKAAVKPGGVAS